MKNNIKLSSPLKYRYSYDCYVTISKLDYIPLMWYGIGTLRDNQRTQLCLISGCLQLLELLEILEIYWNFKISWKSWKSTEFCEAPGKINKLTESEWVADPIDGAWRRETGSLFHSDGPATANTHRPNELDILASRWVQSQPLCNTVPTRPSSKHLMQRRSTLLFNFPLMPLHLLWTHPNLTSSWKFIKITPGNPGNLLEIYFSDFVDTLNLN